MFCHVHTEMLMQWDEIWDLPMKMHTRRVGFLTKVCMPFKLMKGDEIERTWDPIYFLSFSWTIHFKRVMEKENHQMCNEENIYVLHHCTAHYSCGSLTFHFVVFLYSVFEHEACCLLVSCKLTNSKLENPKA